jgi:hypothetical protein
MTYKKSVIILLVLMVAMILIVPLASAGEQDSDRHLTSDPKIASSQAKFVDNKKAESNALSEIRIISEHNPHFSNWTDASVKLGTTYYDLNDEKTAYAFNILVDNNYSGYILTSATTDNFPILAFSHGKIPGSDPRSEYNSMITAKEGSPEKGLSPTKGNPVYLGGLAFYDEYQLTDSKGQSKGRIFVDVHTNKVVNLSSTSQGIAIPVTDQEFTQYEENQKSEIKESWNPQNTALSNNRAGQFAALSYSWNSLNGVPQYFWTRGCSPTAAAMVLAYYSYHGYSNLPTDSTLINQLADNMGTDASGTTWFWNIASGINMLINNYNYNTLSATTDILPTWSGDVTEIDSIRPFVLNMYYGGTATGRSQAYGNHSVTCIGYTGNTGSPDQQFLEVYDTWWVAGESNYESHFIHYNNWMWAANTYVRPS